MLLAIDVAVAQGRTVGETDREHAISEQTYHPALFTQMLMEPR